MGNNLISTHQSKHQSQNKYEQLNKVANHDSWISQQQEQLQQSMWKDITHQNIYYRRQYGKFNIYRNQSTGEQIQKYKVVLNDKQQFQDWKEIVSWRNNHGCLVRIEHFQIHNQGQMCVKQYEMDMFVERIPLRLSDLTDIPYPENLYFLLAAIKGFKYVFSYPLPLKSFRITQSMISVNKQGLIKVWLNPNFSQNLPMETKQTQHLTQEDILKNIIDMVQQNTDQKDYPYTFRQYLYDKKIIINGDFNLVIQQLYSYAKDMRVTIPKYAFSVRDVLNKDFFNTAKLQTQNSVINHVNVKGQSRQIKRDNSQQVLYPSQIQGINQNQRVAFKEQGENNLFPMDKMHGLIASGKQQNPQANQPILNRPTSHKNHLPQQIPNNIPVQQLMKQRTPFTDRATNQQYRNNPPVIINKIGNNIIQYRPAQIPRRVNFINNNQYLLQTNQRGGNSLDRPHNLAILQTASPGYHMVQRQMAQMPGNFQNRVLPSSVQKHHTNFFVPVPHRLQVQHIPQQYNPIIPVSQSTQTNQIIYRANQITIGRDSVQRPNLQGLKPENPTTIIKLAQTIRPQRITNVHNNQKTIQQSSSKHFSKQSSHQSLNRTNSFKNSLLKANHTQQIQNHKLFGQFKYFTKKDSQQTLDPQIAADLFRFMQLG